MNALRWRRKPPGKVFIAAGAEAERHRVAARGEKAQVHEPCANRSRSLAEAVEGRQVGELAEKSERRRLPGVLHLLMRRRVAVARPGHPDRLIERQIRRLAPGHGTVPRP